MRKSEIINCAVSGLELDGRDVARVSRRHKGVITMRHAWRDNDDGRVLYAVHRAARFYAGDICERIGDPVEIYTHDGIMLDQVTPWV